MLPEQGPRLRRCQYPVSGDCVAWLRAQTYRCQMVAGRTACPHSRETEAGGPAGLRGSVQTQKVSDE